MYALFQILDRNHIPLPTVYFLGYFELYWSSPHVTCLFDDLIVNISAAAILHAQVFSEVEKILLQNILQEHTFSAMLAIDIWDLVLR